MSMSRYVRYGLDRILYKYVKVCQIWPRQDTIQVCQGMSDMA